MTQESQDAIARRLRSARLAQGLDVAALGRELKMPQSVFEAMERGDWTRLGAPVYARALLGRYASRLGVEVDVDTVIQQVRDPELRSHVAQSRLGRVADFSARQAAYAGGTLLVLPLLYMLVTQLPDAGRSGQRALDPVAANPSAPEALSVDLEPAGDSSPGAVPAVLGMPSTAVAHPAGQPALPSPLVDAPPTPVAAGLAPPLPLPSSALQLRFSADSWIEIYGRDGRVIEKLLARSGEIREWPVAEVGRVTIGNVEGTTVAVNGSGVNLDAVRAANVARFALSSDGVIKTVAR
ncbi:MAG: RodZ domain-containing protein [Lysobacteraceae bacterium]